MVRLGLSLLMEDAICLHCGAELEFPDVAIAPESHTRAREHV